MIWHINDKQLLDTLEQITSNIQTQTGTNQAVASIIATITTKIIDLTERINKLELQRKEWV